MEPSRHLNGYSADLYTRVHVIETESKHLRDDLKELKQEIKEMRSDVSSLKKYIERAIGGGMAVGVVFGVVKFIVPLFVQ